MDDSIYNPRLPFVGPLHTGLTTGSLIRIQGTVLSNATCFSVNLQCGPAVNYGSDIALHLSPVFSPPPRVVRNSFENQRWGAEESHGPGFPFVAGQGFEIMIWTDMDHFKIAINGQHYTEFHHRIPVHRISHLALNGDANISRISFEGSPARAPSPSLSGGGFAGGFMAPSAPPNQPLHSPSIGVPPPYPSNPPPMHFGSSPGNVPPYPAQPSPYPGYGGSQLPTPQAGYPAQPYPQQGTYPAYPGGTTYPGGSSVQYPHSPTSQKSGLLPAGLGAGLAAGAATLGAAMLNKSHKPGKHKKHSALLPGGLAAGAAALTGAGLMGHGHQQHHRPYSQGKHGHHSSMLPAGMAVGAAALTGAALMGRGPLGKVMKPKKMKKMYKHKGWGSSSSSSSSSEEE